MAEFTDNLADFLADKLKEFSPDIDTGEGTAIRDLFIKPFTTVFQPIVDEILKIREGLSLEGAAGLSELDLDRLAANFSITRKAGAKATGIARVFFNAPTDEFIPEGSVFLSANGTRFLSTSDVTVTPAGLRLNAFGEIFFVDINVEAEEAGTDGNIAASLITEIQLGNDAIVDVTNTAAFTGGTDTETNTELLERLAIAITFRNLINKSGAKLILLQGFIRLIDVLVVGFADQHAVAGEAPTPAPNGSATVFQLVETEDVVASSVDVFVKTPDTATNEEGVASGGPFTNGQIVNLDYFPVKAGTLRLYNGFAGPATLATETTHYTVNLSTGAVTLTAAGATFFNLAIIPVIKATYEAGPLDSSFVSGAFNGQVTFIAAPTSNRLITVDYAYHLMRRDRISGTGLSLGDDTFGTVSNVHVGGKVDYYLRFSGLEEKESKLNTLKAANFLFDQTTNDPPPTGTQQYIAGMSLPLVAVKNIELVDPGTDLPSGTFLTRVTETPAPPNEYRMTVMAGKTNLNLSTRQRIQLEVSSDVVGQSVLLRHFTHQDFAAVRDFVDDDTNRIVTADLLARAPMPVFVSMAIGYARPTGGPSPSDVQKAVTDFINGKKLSTSGNRLSSFDIAKALSAAGVEFVDLPLNMTARRVNLDFSEIQISATELIEVPPNFQFIADTISVTEIQLSGS